MPAVEIQAIPMDVEQREVIGTLIHLGVEHDAVGGGDIEAIRPQREELLRSSLGVARDPLRDDPAFQFDAQRDPAGRQRCHTGNQPQPAASLPPAPPSDVLRLALR